MFTCQIDQHSKEIKRERLKNCFINYNYILSIYFMLKMHFHPIIILEFQVGPM